MVLPCYHQAQSEEAATSAVTSNSTLPLTAARRRPTTAEQEHERNDRAYRRLKAHIDRTCPPGHFVALVAGDVAADAPTFEELQAKLDRIAADRERSFVIQAGVDYPEYEVVRQTRGS